MDADATPLLPRGALEDDGATRERDERGRRRWRRGVAIAALFALGGCAAIASRDLGGRKATTDATTRDRDASEATGGKRDDARTRTRTETRAGRQRGTKRGTRDARRDARRGDGDARRADDGDDRVDDARARDVGRRRGARRRRGRGGRRGGC